MPRFRSSKVPSISRAAVERRRSRSSTRRSSLCVFIVIPATATVTASAIFVVFSLDPARPQGHQLITCTRDIVLGRSTARVFLFKCSQKFNTQFAKIFRLVRRVLQILVCCVLVRCVLRPPDFKKAMSMTSNVTTLSAAIAALSSRWDGKSLLAVS